VQASVTARLKEIKGDEEAKDEAAVLNEWLKLADEEANLKKRHKEAEAALDAKAYAQYPKLSDEEVKALVVEGMPAAGYHARGGRASSNIRPGPFFSPGSAPRCQAGA
jgi:hypothetical protein